MREHDLNEMECTYCGNTIHYQDSHCPFCGKLNESAGWRETGRTQCGNCHAFLEAEDKYCRICGTRVGEGPYEPYQDLMECIYGPMPEDRTHICKSCGYKWTTCKMLDEEKYCPKCGGHAPYEGYEPHEEHEAHEEYVPLRERFR